MVYYMVYTVYNGTLRATKSFALLFQFFLCLVRHLLLQLYSMIEGILLIEKFRIKLLPFFLLCDFIGYYIKRFHSDAKSSKKAFLKLF